MRPMFFATSLSVLMACGGATEGNPIVLGNPDQSPGDATAATPATPGPVTAPTLNVDKVETIVSGQTLPTGIAVGGGAIFFTSEGRPDVGRIDLDGNRRAILNLNLDSASNGSPLLHADAKGAFFASDKVVLGAAATGCALDCDGFIPQFRTDIVEGSVISLALDDTYVYILTAVNVFDNAVYRAKRSLTERYTAATPTTPELIASWKEDRAAHLVASGNSLFASGDRTIHEIALATNKRRLIAIDGPLGPFGVDATHFHWVDSRGLVRKSRSAGTVEVVVPFQTPVGSPRFAAIGTRGVYAFTDTGSDNTGILVRFDAQSKSMTKLATDLAGALYGVASEGWFYFADPRNGAVKRVRDQ